MSSIPPHAFSKAFIPDEWERVRDSGIAPLFESGLDADPSRREEFLRGAGELRLFGERARSGVSLTPQNLRVADMVNAGHEFNGLSKPRRSSKTTSLFALAIGRCMSRENYLAAYTVMTRALKARDRFYKDIVPPLEFLYPDPKTSPWKVVKAGGREQLVHRETGSVFAILAPKGEAFRSDAWDFMILDEGGEARPEATEDVLAGALSTMDTRDGAQLVIAGTAAKYRKGNLLWDQLEQGRSGEGGILEYAADQKLTPEDIPTWDEASALLEVVHPGVGTLTTLDKLKSRYERLKPEQFLAEYLGVFGQIGSTAFIDQTKWSNGRDEGDLPTPPEYFTMAFQVHPDSTSAAVVAAWREDDGRACLLELYHGGLRDFHTEIVALARKYKMPVAYDSGHGATDSEAQKLDRQRPKPRLLSQRWAEVSSAAPLLVKEINAGNLRHWGQPGLDAAARDAHKRGTPESKRWAFGRGGNDEADITAIEAASIALRAFDESPPRAALRPVVA